MTAPTNADPGRAVVAVLGVLLDDLASVSVSFQAGGGVLVNVFDRDAAFVSRLIDLLPLDEPGALGQVHYGTAYALVSFERRRHAHLEDGLSLHWFCSDPRAALGELLAVRAGGLGVLAGGAS